MKIKSLILILIVVLFAKITRASQSDTTYLEIKKIEISDTILIRGLTKYIDSLKKVTPTNDTTNYKWYLRLTINRGLGYRDTIDTRYMVEYTRTPYNPDDADNLFPAYYCIVRNIPMVIDVDRYPDFLLSDKLKISNRSKNQLIELLTPYTPPPEINFTAVDEITGKVRVFKKYWPYLWRDGEYKLKLSITKTMENNVIVQIKKQY